MNKHMNKQEIAELFKRGQDCSQVVASYYAKQLGYSAEEMNRMSAAFGGGMGRGEACGAVVGAMIVLGLKYGNIGPDDPGNKELMGAKRAEFLEKWYARRQSVACRDLLGHDFSKPGEFEAVLEEGTMFTLCPELVCDAIAILDEILA